MTTFAMGRNETSGHKEESDVSNADRHRIWRQRLASERLSQEGESDD
jgi:hypothetical protein